MTNKSAVLVTTTVELGRTGNQQGEAGDPPFYAVRALGEGYDVKSLAPSAAERATEVALPDQSERGTTTKASFLFHWQTLLLLVVRSAGAMGVAAVEAIQALDPLEFPTEDGKRGAADWIIAALVIAFGDIHGPGFQDPGFHYTSLPSSQKTPTRVQFFGVRSRAINSPWLPQTPCVKDTGVGIVTTAHMWCRQMTADRIVTMWTSFGGRGAWAPATLVTHAV